MSEEIIFGFQYRTIRVGTQYMTHVFEQSDDNKERFFINLVNRLETWLSDYDQATRGMIGDLDIGLTTESDDMAEGYDLATSVYTLSTETHILAIERILGNFPGHQSYYLVVRASSQQALDILLTALMMSL